MSKGKKSILIDPRQPDKKWLIEIQKDGRITKWDKIEGDKVEINNNS